MNVITIVGIIGTDPTTRTMESGKTTASFRVAVRNPWRKDPSGHAHSDWFQVNAYDKTAEYVLNYLGKGDHVAVSGRMLVVTKTSSDGTKNTYHSIEAMDVNRAGKSGVKDDSPQAPAAPQPKAKPKAPAPAQFDDSDVFDPFADE